MILMIFMKRTYKKWQILTFVTIKIRIYNLILQILNMKKL